MNHFEEENSADFYLEFVKTTTFTKDHNQIAPIVANRRAVRIAGKTKARKPKPFASNQNKY